MKILYVHEMYPPEAVGGGETYSEMIVQQLKKNGHEVMVVAGTSGKNRVDKRKGVKVYRVNTGKSRYMFNFKCKQIKKTIKKFKPDIIHTNAYNAAIPASIAGKKLNIPVVVNLHFFFQKDFFKYFNPITASLFYLMERFNLIFHYDKIVALDYNIFTKLKKIKKKNIVFIPHLIDTKLFKPKKKPKKFTIGTQFTSGPSKRNDLFFDLAEKYKDYDIDFLVVGSASDEMKNKLRKLGIKYMGRIPHNQMPKFYNKIHVYYGHGMAAKEAMACGAPAILNHNVSRLTGYHHKELKEKVMIKNDKEILKLYKNKTYWKKISKKSHKFIERNYSAKIILPQFIKLYKKLIKT